MTLIAALKSEHGLILAADGMAYYNHGDSDVPHPVRKVKRVSGKNWLFAFSGRGIAETVFHTLEAQIQAGRLELDHDIRVGVNQYFQAFDVHFGSAEGCTVVLAGYGSDGEPYVFVHATRTRQTDCAGDVFCAGAQHAAALWIISKFRPNASSVEDLQFLAHFAIEQVANQELKVGSPDRYRIDIGTILPGNEPSFSDEEVVKKFVDGSEGLIRRLGIVFRESKPSK